MERVEFRSADPFEFYHIIARPDEMSGRDMSGTLSLPSEAGPDHPVPAVIACHGSWGWRAHHEEHLQAFRDQGFAVFQLHSFEARGIESTAERQMAVTMAMMVHDAFSALAVLLENPSIDGARVGVTGWSLGGGMAVYSAWEPLAERLAPEGARFAAHLGFYPACHMRCDDMRWSGAPMLILIGEAEDYTPAVQAVDLTRALVDAGVPAEIILYPDAHHSFDSRDPVVFHDKVQALTPAPLVRIRQDGSMVVEGTEKPLNEPEDRLANAPVFSKRGAHAGGNPKAREAAFRDAARFMGTTLQI
ncbi:MAG: dienelactone hydrolase family protein [Parvularculales bacterium]